MDTNREIGALWCHFKDKTKEIKQIILDLVNNASKEDLAAGNAAPKDFLVSINAIIAKYGACWEDIIIHFQWRAELKQIL